MKVLFIILVFFSFVTHGQDNRYDKLLKIAKQKGGVVVSCYPLTKELNSWGLKRSTRQREDSIMTDSLIIQIVEATKNWDKTKWKSKEFKGTAVIENRSKNLNTKRLLNEWGIYDKVERDKYRRQINKWLSTDVDSRPINYLSRPILTKDKNFGLIAVDLVSNGLCCGGEITLYKFESNEWRDLGAIYIWAH